MRLLSLESHNLSRVGYDPAAGQLGVEFNGRPGVLYRFNNVTPLMFVALVCAPSVGKFFNRHIRSWPAMHPYTTERIA